MDTIIVENFGKRLTFALCNAERQIHCTVNHEYVTGRAKPNYPMPAIRMRTFDSLVKLGFTSAENNFDVDTVFEYYIKN